MEFKQLKGGCVRWQSTDLLGLSSKSLSL